MRSDSCYGHVKQVVSLHAFHGATRYIYCMFRIGRLILGLLGLELTVSPS